MEDPRLALVEEEIIGLPEEFELIMLLGSDNGGGAATEAAVVDSGYTRLVVGEFLTDFGFCNEGRKLLFLRYMVAAVVVVMVVNGGAAVGKVVVIGDFVLRHD